MKRKKDKSIIPRAAFKPLVRFMKGGSVTGPNSFDWPPLPECMAQEDLNRRRAAIRKAREKL